MASESPWSVKASGASPRVRFPIGEGTSARSHSSTQILQDDSEPALIARTLSAAIAVLAIAAAAAGLFFQSLYRDPATITPAMRGQDAVTLIVAPLMFVSVWLGAEGSARARILSLGFTGYLAYTYAGAAFGYRYNPLLLVYIAILSLSAALLMLLSRRVSGRPVMPRLGRHAPRRPAAIFLLCIALILAWIELAEIATSLVTGVVPASVQRAGGMTFFPYVLDLGFVVPLSLITMALLWRARPLGDVLGAALLVKAATMGAALVAMNAMSRLAGQPADGLTAFYAVIAIGGAALSWACLRTP